MPSSLRRISRLADMPPTSLFRAESLGEAVGVYLPATAAFRVIGLIRNIILAWLLSPAQFGLFFLSLLVVNVLTPVAGLSLHDAVARYAPAFETRGALRAFLRRLTPRMVLVAAVGGVLLLATANPVGEWLFESLRGGPQGTPAPGEAAGPGQAVPLTRWAAVALFAQVLYFFVLSTLKGLRMFRAMGLMDLTHTILFTLGALGAVALGGRTADAVLVVFAAALLIAMLVFGAGLRRRVVAWPDQQRPLEAGERVMGRMLRFSLWTTAATVMTQILQNYPTWYLNKVHGQEATAVFGGVRTVTQVTLIVAVTMISIVTTLITRAWEAEGRAAADRRFALAFKTTGLLLLGMSAAVAAAKPLVIRLFPPGFAPGREIIQPLLLFFLLCGYLSFLSLHFNLIEKTRALFFVWAVGVAGNIVASWYWVRPAPAGDSPPSLAAQMVPAAHAGVAAMAVALAVCLVFLRLERRPVDRGTWLVIGAGFTLCLPWPAVVATVTALVLLARPLLFGREEWVALRQQTADVRRTITHWVRSRSTPLGCTPASWPESTPPPRQSRTGEPDRPPRGD